MSSVFFTKPLLSIIGDSFSVGNGVDGDILTQSILNVLILAQLETVKWV